MALKDRVKASVARVRERSPLADHVLRMQEHYSGVNASQQAGGVTYFGFLSVFPVLALAFFVVGYVADVVPAARANMIKAIDEVLPGLVGGDANEVPLDDIQSAAGAVGLIGLAGVLYAGLGWLSSLQTALGVVFELPERLRPSFVIGKVRDLITLVVLGVVLLVSVAASGVLTRMSRQVLDLVDIEGELGWLVALVGVLFGVAASTLLFFLLFRLLARPPVPDRSLWSGAVLGAIGFEVLKQLSSLLLASTKGQPAFQAFGIALILLVWINYFSRVVLYAAAWAHTSERARAERAERAERTERTERAAVVVPEEEGVPEGADVHVATATPPVPGRALPLAVGGGIGAVLGALLARRRR